MSRNSDRLFQKLHLLGEAAFDLECWLNPERFPWGDDPGTPSKQFGGRHRYGSPIAVIDLLGDLRECLDTLYIACGWQRLCDHKSISWNFATIIRPGRPAIPRTLAGQLEIAADQLQDELKVHRLTRKTTNRIPAKDIADCVELTRCLVRRIKAYESVRLTRDKAESSLPRRPVREEADVSPTSGAEQETARRAKQDRRGPRGTSPQERLAIIRRVAAAAKRPNRKLDKKVLTRMTQNAKQWLGFHRDAAGKNRWDKVYHDTGRPWRAALSASDQEKLILLRNELLILWKRAPQKK